MISSKSIPAQGSGLPDIMLGVVGGGGGWSGGWAKPVSKAY